MSGFANSIIGGMQKLIRAAIQSPNYIAGLAGWSINKDGSAEFNNLIVRGTFDGNDFILDSSGLFIYSGTPAFGNLIATITPLAGTDAFGNSYEAGITSRENVFGTSTNIFGSALDFKNAVATSVQMELNTQGLFLYKPPGGASGNLIVSLAKSAGTDPYGNAYPQGLNVTVGTITGAAITGSTFTGADFVINDSGAFFYSGTPAADNLILSIARASGTDSHGNDYFAGLTTYTFDGTVNVWTAAQINGSNTSWYSASTHENTWSAVRSSIQFTGLDIVVGSNAVSGVGGAISLVCDTSSGQVSIGSNGEMLWDQSGKQLSLPAGGGPFTTGAGGFHGVSAASGMSTPLTGSVAVRVKKLPWNAIWIEVESAISTTATTLNLGSLPDSSYYPTTARHFPIVTTGSVIGRLFVPTSGGLQIIFTASANGLTIGGAYMYANN